MSNSHLDVNSHRHSITIPLTVGIVFTCYMLLAIIYLFMEHHVLGRSRHRMEIANQKRRFITTHTFFNALLPAELSGEIWPVRYFQLLCREHLWLRLWYGLDDNIFLPIVVKMACRTLNIGFVTTLLIDYLFRLDDKCKLAISEADCIDYSDAHSNFVGFDNICVWDVDIDTETNHTHYSCMAGPPTHRSVVILIVIVVLCSTVLHEATTYFCTNIHTLLHRIHVRNEAMHSLLDNMHDNGLATIKRNKDDIVEFGCLQSLKNSLLRGACLDQMRSNMDDVPLSYEAVSIVNDSMSVEKSANLDIVEKVLNDSDYISKLKSQKIQIVMSDRGHRHLIPEEEEGHHDIENPATAALTSVGAYWKLSRLDEYLLQDVSALHARNMIATSYRLHAVLTARLLKRARKEAVDIAAYLQLQHHSDVEKNLYLLKKFIIGFMSRHDRNRIERIFFKDFESILSVNTFTATIQYGSIVLLVIYFILALIYQIAVGLTLRGVYNDSLWLQVFFVGNMLDIAVITPLRILTERVLISVQGNERVRCIHGLLRTRCNAIMKRRVSLKTVSNSLIQHFNPACRAARMIPHLQVSRLLMSITDFDLPESLLHKHSVAGEKDDVLDDEHHPLSRYYSDTHMFACCGHFAEWILMLIPAPIKLLLFDLMVLTLMGALWIMITLLLFEGSFGTGVFISCLLFVLIIYAVMFKRYQIPHSHSPIIHPVDASLGKKLTKRHHVTGDIVVEVKDGKVSVSGDSLAMHKLKDKNQRGGGAEFEGAVELMNRGNYRKYWYKNPLGTTDSTAAQGTGRRVNASPKSNSSNQVSSGDEANSLMSSSRIWENLEELSRQVLESEDSGKSYSYNYGDLSLHSYAPSAESKEEIDESDAVNNDISSNQLTIEVDQHEHAKVFAPVKKLTNKEIVHSSLKLPQLPHLHLGILKGESRSNRHMFDIKVTGASSSDWTSTPMASSSRNKGTNYAMFSELAKSYDPATQL